MALNGSLPKSIFMLMNLVTALGAIDDSINELFNFDIIIYLIGQLSELRNPLYFLTSFFGFCLFLINVEYLLLKAKAKMIVSKLTKRL